MSRNVTINPLTDKSQYDCKPDQTVLSPPPCFAGDVKVNLVINEGETAELRCFVYNVDFSKTLVSWWKERELQEISLGLTTQDKRFYLPRRFYEDWTLVIKKVQNKDAGGYSCQINSKSVLEKMFSIKVIGNPLKKAVVHETFWLVKDEEYTTGDSKGLKSVHKQSEFKFDPTIIRSGPHILTERFQKLLNGDRFQRTKSPKTSSTGFHHSLPSINLLALSKGCKDNDWTVSKMEWEDFEFNTWLPGRYSTIVTNAGLAAFNESKCSTKHVNCSYSFDSKNYTRIKLWGTMSPDLMWATFKGDGNLVPVTVYFFNNKTWGNIDHKMLQPQFSLPLVITASGQEIVTFTCVFTNYIGAEVNIYFGDKMRLVYNSTVNAISNYSQILNVEAKRMTIFERYTLTVKKVNEIDYYTCSVNGQYLTHAIIWSIICTFAGAEEPPMFPNDGRIVYGKLGSTFNYKTVLPGMYNRVASGMHDVIIMKKDCSTPLFKCNIEKEMPHRSVVTLTGTMNYGLKRATFFGNNSIPITVLFYTDHYWPEIDDHTFQWQYSLPLVTYAKDSDIVTISVYILHVSVISLPNFTLTYSASNTPVYREMGYNHLKNYSHILNLEKSVFAMHTIIALTVKKKEYVDYYCFEYNGQHHTHTIVWGKPSPIPKPDVINDFLSLLPMEEVISHFLGSANHTNLLSLLVLMVAALCVNMA
ncbi:hypothetical protein TcWFU_002244 [Taenia crassiceps]|uniref:Ig-like domain-containing protein n=1 Tax=Taenia crassiceps TaxID=6207 RepID=A0ABR4Q9H7_9CEST